MARRRRTDAKTLKKQRKNNVFCNSVGWLLAAKTAPRRPKTHPRRPKMHPRRPKNAPRRHQDGTKTATSTMLSEDRPQEAHERGHFETKMAPRRPQNATRRPKTRPRGFKMAPPPPPRDGSRCTRMCPPARPPLDVDVLLRFACPSRALVVPQVPSCTRKVFLLTRFPFLC